MEYDLPVKESLLLHICCAPDATYPVELLSKEFEISGYFCNPNVQPPGEHERRLDETRKFMEKKGLTLHTGNFSPRRWKRAVKGLEDEPEGGRRCSLCYRMRLEDTAKFAKRMGFSFYTTTLTISPHKNSKAILAMGREIASKYGLRFLECDFKKKGGFTRSVELSKKAGLYRQDYCGCTYSLIERMRGKRNDLVHLLEEMTQCTKCPSLWRKKVLPSGDAASRVVVVGLAPGKEELRTQLPFSGPAGRRLFGWLQQIGIGEAEFRNHSYITATVKCYPGHVADGKRDLAPSAGQVRTCAHFLEREIRLLRPSLIVPVGGSALNATVGEMRLSDAVGKKWRRLICGHLCDIIPLPHPSGASPWVYKHPRLHAKALALLQAKLRRP